jgi:hypothetical protein
MLGGVVVVSGSFPIGREAVGAEFLDSLADAAFAPSKLVLRFAWRGVFADVVGVLIVLAHPVQGTAAISAVLAFRFSDAVFASGELVLGFAAFSGLLFRIGFRHE